VRPIRLLGVQPSWLASFAALCFAPDNPLMRVSERLHRPGMVRTNERLDASLGERDALMRSQYINERMRPQGLRHTPGNTVLAQGDTVSNLTLMLPPDMPCFSAAEIRCFERLTRHLSRSLSLALTLGSQPGSAQAAAWQRLPQRAALLASPLRMVAANRAIEASVQADGPLTWRAGCLIARDARAHQRPWAGVAALSMHAADSPPDPLWLTPYLGSEGVTLQMLPFTFRPASPFVPTERRVVVLLDGATDRPKGHAVLLLQRHGCTARSARSRCARWPRTWASNTRRCAPASSGPSRSLKSTRRANSSLCCRAAARRALVRSPPARDGVLGALERQRRTLPWVAPLAMPAAKCQRPLVGLVVPRVADLAHRAADSAHTLVALADPLPAFDW
jgi:hypothetical protein